MRCKNTFLKTSALHALSTCAILFGLTTPVIAQDAVSPGTALFSKPARTREHLQLDPATYERYTRPGQCQTASMRADRFFGRDHPDTLAINIAIDTIPDVVAAVARACVAKFKIDQVPTDQLVQLSIVYLLSKQPDLASKATHQFLKSTSTLNPRRRAELLRQMVEGYILMRPRRISDIKALLAAMDSMGPPGANASMDAHALLAQSAPYWDDTQLSIDNGEQAVVAWSKMSNDERSDEVAPMSRVYGSLSDANRMQSGPSAGLAVYERSKPDLLSTRPTSHPQYSMIQNWIEGSIRNYPFYGSKSRKIESQHWFNTNGDTAARPKAGKVTLIYFMTPSCGNACYGQFAMIRRLHEKYDTAGFEILIVSKTSGFFRMELTLDPDIEVEMIRKYYLDYLKLPVVLSVTETQFSRMHDGRRMAEQNPNEVGWPNGDVVLVDREGKIAVITTGYTSTQMWMSMERQLQDALKK